MLDQPLDLIDPGPPHLLQVVFQAGALAHGGAKENHALDDDGKRGQKDQCHQGQQAE